MCRNVAIRVASFNDLLLSLAHFSDWNYPISDTLKVMRILPIDSITDDG